MATIHLTDDFGLDVEVSPDPISVFAKYVKGLAGGHVSLKDQHDLGLDTIGTYPFKSQCLGVCFDEPVPLGTSAVELTITPKVSGSINLDDGSDLLDSTLYARPEAQPLMDQKYLSLGLHASIEGDLSQLGDLQFGFAAGTEVVLTYSRPVAPADKLVPSLKAAFQSFTLPGDLEDLDRMAAGSITSVEGTGTLTFSGTVNLLATVNPLATVATGASFLKGLSLDGSGSIEVNTSVTLDGGYQLQVSKLDANRFLLGYFRNRGSEFDINFTSEVALTAGTKTFDLIPILLKAVSSDVKAPSAELDEATAAAGLADDDASSISDTIATAIKAGIQRNLAISFAADLDLSNEHTAAFLYEIDLAALDAGGRMAVHRALDGNLSAIDSGKLAGISVLRTVFGTSRDQTRALTVNLLGILNVGSVRELLAESTLVIDPDTGDITITDQTTASEVGYTINNFAKDGAKLRQLLADGFLATCVYRASQTGFKTDVKSTGWAFALTQSTSYHQIEDYLNIAASLNLISRDEAGQRLAQVQSVRQFGKTIFLAASKYDDPLFESLFLDQGQVLPQSFYEQIGRQAMAATLPPSDPDDPIRQARLLPLTNSKVWDSMSGGQTTFRSVLSAYKSNEVELSDIIGDYSIIKWWAQAMHDLGVALADMQAFLKSNDVKDPNNNTFIRKRTDLDQKLERVLRQTHNRFAEPWGLVAMDMASRQRSDTSVLLTSPRLSISLSRKAQIDAQAAVVAGTP
jgi:hypothetical protein